MSIEKTIIEELDAIAKIVIEPEDLPRWEKTKEFIFNRMVSGEMHEAAKEAMEQLHKYTGSDFVFEATTAPIDAGMIVYFQLGNMTPNIPAFVNAQHEYSGKWKYDLIIPVKMPDGWHTTRIYNVESKWLTMM